MIYISKKPAARPSEARQTTAHAAEARSRQARPAPAAQQPRRVVGPAAIAARCGALRGPGDRPVVPRRAPGRGPAAGRAGGMLGRVNRGWMAGLARDNPPAPRSCRRYLDSACSTETIDALNPGTTTSAGPGRRSRVSRLRRVPSAAAPQSSSSRAARAQREPVPRPRARRCLGRRPFSRPAAMASYSARSRLSPGDSDRWRRAGGIRVLV